MRVALEERTAVVQRLTGALEISHVHCHGLYELMRRLNPRESGALHQLLAEAAIIRCALEGVREDFEAIETALGEKR